MAKLFRRLGNFLRGRPTAAPATIPAVHARQPQPLPAGIAAAPPVAAAAAEPASLREPAVGREPPVPREPVVPGP